MNRRVLAGAVVLLFVVVSVAVGAVLLTGGPGNGDAGATLERVWLSDTARETTGNHHAATVGVVNGEAFVYAPISGPQTDNCALVALSGRNGSVAWRHRVPPEQCEVHAVADVGFADFVGDARPEVLATTTEAAVFAFAPTTGERVFRYDLPAYGYSKPIVADLAPGDGRELVVVDAKGTVSVVRPDGSLAWNRSFRSYVWAQPAVHDFDGDGANELVAGFQSNAVRMLDGDGETLWERSGLGGSVTWLSTGDLTGSPRPEVTAATDAGRVVVFDGTAGGTAWTKQVGQFAAVEVVAGHVYVTDADGVLRKLDGETGRVVWETRVAAESVQMTPPVAAGDLDGDGDREVVAVTTEGRVVVLAPDDGTVLASAEREGVPVYAPATLSDVDGDGDDEVVVVFGDGRTALLDYA